MLTASRTTVELDSLIMSTVPIRYQAVYAEHYYLNDPPHL